MLIFHLCFFFFFFNDTATTEIYTLSLHDALPIWMESSAVVFCNSVLGARTNTEGRESTSSAMLTGKIDRKSTRLNSSHLVISYAVFCLKKKKEQNNRQTDTDDVHRLIRVQSIAYL